MRRKCWQYDIPRSNGTPTLNADISRSKLIMIDWLIPKTLKNLQGFLGLAGYYHKFVQNYGRIEPPLTTLLRKDAFSWTPKATQDFQQLKEAMCKGHILATSDLTKTLYCGM